jgi:hypothetical protein
MDGREAAFEDEGDKEQCLDLCGKHARQSSRISGETISEVRDRLETVVLEFLDVRYVARDGKRYCLATALRSEYETPAKLKEFLGEFGLWVQRCVVRTVRGEPHYTWRLSGSDEYGR